MAVRTYTTWAFQAETSEPTPGGIVPKVAETSRFTYYTPSQWRILQTLHWSDRQTTPVKGARGLLGRQEASIEDLLDLSRNRLVEGVVPGAILDLTAVNWSVRRSGPSAIQCRITIRGNRVMWMPMPMVLYSTGRGRRYTIKEIGMAAGLDGFMKSETGHLVVSGVLGETLRAAEQLGLVRACGDDGQSHNLSSYTHIPANLRLSLTRKGGTYLSRKGH